VCSSCRVIAPDRCHHCRTCDMCASGASYINLLLQLIAFHVQCPQVCSEAGPRASPAVHLANATILTIRTHMWILFSTARGGLSRYYYYSPNRVHPHSHSAGCLTASGGTTTSTLFFSLCMPSSSTSTSCSRRCDGSLSSGTR
jgi:hypothetical protein